MTFTEDSGLLWRQAEWRG